MVASQATMEQRAESPALELANQMENLASKGDWTRAEQLAFQIRNAVLESPKSTRRNLLSAVAQVLARVQTLALTSKIEVAEKLSGIHRGRAAKRAYGQPEDNSISDERR